MRCALQAAKPGLRLLRRRCLTVRALAPSPAAVQQLLDSTDFLLPDPAVQVTPIRPEGFALVRDDLLHPLLGGNKQRKLDGLWPSLAQATDVVTCGGLQSAHTLAVAAACAERGKRCHLLVRGERPAVPTGTHLYARLLAHRVVYVPRSQYADRQAMFGAYLRQLRQEQQDQQQQGQQQGEHGSARPGAPLTSVPNDSSDSPTAGGTQDRSGSQAAAAAGEHAIAVIPEGAAEPAALLGLIRLVAWLAGDPRSPLGSGSSGGSSSSSVGDGGEGGRRCHLVVDSGTGATATGLALGAALLGLPWRVCGVMLAAEQSYYEQQQRELTAAFSAQYGPALLAAEAAGWEAAAVPAAATAALEEELQRGVAERLHWVPRAAPRKFGRLLPGDVAACQAVAQRHGVLLDPIWSLAAWEVSCQLARQQQQQQQGQPASSAASSGGGAAGGAAGAAGQPLVVMLHTGGALGLCGLAQRFPDQF